MVFGGFQIVFVECYKKLFKYCSFSMPQTISIKWKTNVILGICVEFCCCLHQILVLLSKCRSRYPMCFRVQHVVNSEMFFCIPWLYSVIICLLLSFNQLKAVWLFFSLFITFLSRAYLHLSRLSSTCSLLSLQFSVLCKHHSPC